jgi:hypothetical protein
MALLGSGIKVPTVGATVRHPLWPELGIGEVETVSGASDNVVGQRTGRIRWSCGQVSRHNLSVLREVRS